VAETVGQNEAVRMMAWIQYKLRQSTVIIEKVGADEVYHGIADEEGGESLEGATGPAQDRPDFYVRFGGVGGAAVLKLGQHRQGLRMSWDIEVIRRRDSNADQRAVADEIDRLFGATRNELYLGFRMSSYFTDPIIFPETDRVSMERFVHMGGTYRVSAYSETGEG
jgi:hypothetical protein